MSAPKRGFVYVLINQTMPGCVKIGRTSRSPEARASELSSVTGVPTPFLVAYQAEFDDCHEAESYVHALLEVGGARLANNREFFTVQSAVAVNAVVQAQQKFGSPKDINQFDCADVGEVTSELIGNELPPWFNVLEEAESYMWGTGDNLQDERKAVELFKTAAKLGSGNAYVALGEHLGGSAGMDWFRQGADRDHAECWLALADIFAGENFMFSEIPPNRDSARKAYGRFFRSVHRTAADPRQMYFAFERYLKLIDHQPTSFDIESINSFLPFMNIILSNLDEPDRGHSIGQLSRLLDKYLPTR